MTASSATASKSSSGRNGAARIRGRNIIWPDRCVGCARRTGLAHKNLHVHAQDGGLNKHELESTEPASTIMTWSYPICRLCLTDNPHLSHAWYVGDATVAVSAAAAMLAATLGGASPFWILTAAITAALYGTIRLLTISRFRRYLSSLPRRNEAGAFVKCTQIVGLDQKPIRGFDNFVELLRRGDVVCEFEFSNISIADDFRSLNTQA